LAQTIFKRGEEKEEKDENKTGDVHTHNARLAIESKTNLVKSNSKGDKNERQTEQTDER
jgi:hypothetical protein